MSWIVAREKGAAVQERSWNQYKVNKRTLISNAERDGFGRHDFFTDEGKKDKIWDNEHRRRIVQKIEFADTETLQRVAQLIGYDSSAK